MKKASRFRKTLLFFLGRRRFPPIIITHGQVWQLASCFWTWGNKKYKNTKNKGGLRRHVIKDTLEFIFSPNVPNRQNCLYCLLRDFGYYWCSQAQLTLFSYLTRKRKKSIWPQPPPPWYKKSKLSNNNDLFLKEIYKYDVMHLGIIIKTKPTDRTTSGFVSLGSETRSWQLEKQPQHMLIGCVCRPRSYMDH